MPSALEGGPVTDPFGYGERKRISHVVLTEKGRGSIMDGVRRKRIHHCSQRKKEITYTFFHDEEEYMVRNFAIRRRIQNTYDISYDTRKLVILYITIVAV